MLVILLLMASGDAHFGWESAWQSVKGDEIKPWLVLGILFSLIYQCITLDATGILKGLATKTVQTFGSNHDVLLAMLFVFSSALTVLTNNDITIIVLTPLMLEIQQNIPSLDVVPFLFMVLFSANTFSLLLISGNPANIIVAQAADLGTTEYIKHMAVPTMATAAVLALALYAMRRRASRSANPQQPLSPRVGRPWTDSVKLPKYAVFCAVRLLLTRIVMAFADDLQSKCECSMDLLLILGIAALSFLVDFMVFDLQNWFRRKQNDKVRALTTLIAGDGSASVELAELPEAGSIEQDSSKDIKCRHSESIERTQNERGFVESENVSSSKWSCCVLTSFYLKSFLRISLLQFVEHGSC